MRATTAFVVAPLLFVLLLAHQAQAYGACLADSPDSKSDSGEQKKDECTAPCIIDCSGCAEYDDEEPLTTEATSTMSSSSSSSAAPTETSSGSSSAGTTESSSSSSSSSSTSSSSSSSSTAVSTSSVASEPCPCLLVKKLNKIKYNLTVSDQIIFEGCMNKIRPVLVDSSKSANKKISLIAHHLRKCFRDNESIKRKMKHEKIGRWGGCYKFLFAGITIDKDNIDSQTTVDSAGKCNLTDAIESQTAGDKCGPGSSYLIGVFTGKVKKILRRLTPGFDKGRKLGWFKKVLFKHLLLNSAVNRSCLLSVKVPEFDSLDHFADSCEQSETSSSAIDYLSGNGDACNLIYSLKQGLNSSANSTNTTILQEAYQFVQELNDYFAQTSDLVLRIKYLSLRFALKSRACRQLLKAFKILGIFLNLDFSDVVSTSHDCTNNGCGNMTYGSPSVTYPECCMVDSASNSSVVEDGCAEHEKNLTSMEKTQWNSYKNSIVNCIRKLYPGDYAAKLECVKTYVRNYCNNVATMKSRFLAVELPPVLIESATEVKHGNFGTLCGCAA